MPFPWSTDVDTFTDLDIFFYYKNIYVRFHQVANAWAYVNTTIQKPFPLSLTWRERIIVYECTFHPSNIEYLTPICLWPSHLKQRGQTNVGPLN